MSATSKKTNQHRQAAAAAAVTHEAHKVVPLAPPYLTPGATEVWYELMNAALSTHFEPTDYRTLAAYCEAAALVERLAPMVAEADPVVTDDNGVSKQNPVFTAFRGAVSSVQGFALRLKLAPSTRTKDSAGSKGATRMAGAAARSTRRGLLFDPRRGREEAGKT